MQWAPQQDEALRRVDEWFRDPNKQQVFYLAGFAGTGKTTLARHFAENVDGTVLFAAYTGKAAHVLQMKGCEGASTIHSLIYHAKDKSARKLKEMEAELAALRGGGGSDKNHIAELERNIRAERDNLARPAFTLNTESPIRDAALIVVDECSMVDGRMGEDLCWFRRPILVLGDPAQLPPVAGGGFFTEREPDFMLTDIHRQAKDSPIIHMATIVREGGKLNLGDYGNCRVVNQSDIGPEDALGADQILVGRNRTRHSSNRRVRSLLGRGEFEYPVSGDKLVCLRNNHDKGLLNGALWDVVGVGDVTDSRVVMDLASRDMENFELYDVEAHMQYFQGIGEKLMWWERKEAEEFDYGYALTVHKSQGSQWDNVLLFDEGWCFREDRNKWLYTGITRAAAGLTVVRM